MIRQLHSRTSADRFKNDVRGSRRRLSRYVYLFSVAVLFAYLVNLFVGPLLWLQADGIVGAERVVVAFPYEAEVVNLSVQPGQKVKKGELLATVRSAQVAETVATLTARHAETYARQAELMIRVDVANAVIDRASERLNEAEANLKRVNATRSSGFVSDTFVNGAVRERYAALQEKVVREAERRSSMEQLTNLKKAQDDAKNALDEIRSHYNEGRVVAPAAGVVGSRVSQQGDVLKSGDYLTEIHVGKKFVLAYLETGAFYKVKKNERVTVSSGFLESEGTLDEVLSITMQLPPEFQKTFRPTMRGQIARIVLDNEDTFPLSAKVRVTGHRWFPGGGN